MNFFERQTNQPSNSQETRLSPEAAQEEANMMRVKLKEIIGHEPTVADYDKALQAIEEMKEAAANETDGQRAFLKAVEAGNKYFQKGVEALYKTITLGMDKRQHGDEHLHMFDSAHTRLELLKAEAEKLEGTK